jgi:heptosyltransferase-1/heptosyltransferase-2
MQEAAATSMPARPGLRYRRVTTDFLDDTRQARKVLVMMMYGGLGDVVHCFPALWAIRRAYPQAQLDVMVAQHYLPMLSLAPWLDGRLGYKTKKSGLTRNEWGYVWSLRRTGYDVTVNLTGNNHGSVLAWASGARWRLGRRPFWDHKKGWRLLQTHVMDFRYEQEPMYRQWLQCLAQAGFNPQAEYQIEVSGRLLDGTRVAPADAGHYIHVSPCKSDDAGQLPLDQMVGLLEGLRQRWPDYRLVLSSSGSERERERMEALLGRLSFEPWRVYRGDIDVAQLSAVIRGAALHLSSDTGPLHIAWMFDVPTVSWFRLRSDNSEYLPQPPLHHAFVIASDASDGIRGLDTQALLDAAAELLANPAPARGTVQG